MEYVYIALLLLVCFLPAGYLVLKTNQAKKDTANIMAATISISAQSGKEDFIMAFFNSAVTVLQTLVVALGAGLGIWGAINLLEGYGNDNPGAKSQGMKQFMAN